MTTINQKDYLKKYLKIGKRSEDRRKKKKVDKTSLKGLKIIDDDVDNSISREIQDDLDAANEDAPQIVAIIDERPPSLRIDEQTKSNLWQPIGESTSISTFQKFKIGSIKLNINKEETANKRKDKKVSKSPNQEVRGLTDELSLTKKSYEQSRKYKSDCESPDIKRDDDYSPPRNKKDIDLFLFRNNTPIRTASGDQYPPRKSKYDKSPSKQRNNYSPSPPRKSKNTDQSPPRKSRSNDQSKKMNDDYSPPRKSITDDQSFRSKREHDKSPSSQKNTRTNKKSRWGEQEDTSPRKIQIPETTMSGKKSGLQTAKNLIKDITHLQHQEEELLKTMSTDVSGANAATIVRKVKKTDQVPDPEKKKREKELKEKYSLWGKGVKQVQDENQKVADQLKEMSKPLARYADDEDLEKYLKEQEREGDPMLAYIRKKKKTAAVEQGISAKPTYLGDFMPNRFGIRPGYRWDGVDRSNGYEKKWFEVENSKKAMQDEALQWSQEDM